MLIFTASAVWFMSSFLENMSLGMRTVRRWSMPPEEGVMTLGVEC